MTTSLSSQRTTISKSKSLTTVLSRVGLAFHPNSSLTKLILPPTAFRGLGHVLAISRGLSTFKHPDAAEEDDMSQSSDGAKVEDGIKWSGNVGQDLRRDEQCLFDSVG